jgi:hypothetical protein
MTGPEAERAGARIAIHLRRNEFAACHEILDHLKSEQTKREFNKAADDRIPIAEVLGGELRCINMLEAAGYIYIEDLDDVDLMEDLTQPGPLYLPWFGKKAAQLVEKGRERAAVIRERRRRAHANEMEEFEMVGEPLLDAKDGWMRA